jgi:hypothetical protein
MSDFKTTFYTQYANMFVVHVRPNFHIVSKGKVNPITWYKANRQRVKVYSALPSTSALERGEWLTSRPGRFTPGNEAVPTV